MAPKIRTQKLEAGELPPLTIMLYGLAKVGKTTMAATFPKPLIVNVLAENGVSMVTGDIVDIQNEKGLNEVITFLLKNEHQYQTLVVDGLDALVETVVTEARKSAGRDPRRAYQKAGQRLIPVLRRLHSLPMTVVITAHAKRWTEETGNGKEKVVKRCAEPNVNPHLRDMVMGLVDIICFCYAGPKGSEMITKPLETATKSIAAGDRTGRLPTKMPLSYEALHKALVSRNGNGK